MSAEDLKAKYIKEVGEWTEEEQALLELDPTYFEAATELLALPARKGHLSPKVRELVHIAADASVCRLSPRVHLHVRAALKAGASKDEILEALECSSVLGIHAATVGVPSILEAFREAGKLPAETPELDAAGQKAKEEFTKARGYWAPLWTDVISLDMDLFQAYKKFSSVPWNRGALEPKVKEFMYIAIDYTTEHLFSSGGLIHLKNAVRYGATPEECMEVLEILVGKGVDTARLGALALKQALDGQ